MNRQFWGELAITLALALIIGFGYSYVTKQGFFSTAAADTKAPDLKIISLAEAKSAFDSHTATFIDARHEFEFAEGHIQGALNFPLAKIKETKNTFQSLSPSARFIIYCDGSSCNSSIELASLLIEHHFTSVAVFFGGWQEWLDAGYPVERSNHSSPTLSIR